MGKKDAKGRLDKYYKLAKDQGYRARSAFKLIQLNNQFNFLQNAKCLVDLCAAPGGWLQVAQNVMPKPSIIIGIDLAPIKSIPNVITFVQDITAEKTKHLIKNEIKNWEVDVFLHDGAPNVGTNWIHDAFGQAQLVLHSLKLATQFLKKNGTFVTKVFRSKDYNNLLWVFHQLFDKVEATKPAASRNVSAEIFVVCLGYKKPDKIDPKLLDLKYVFKELEEPQKTSATMLNDLFHPEKHKRNRAGYEDGNYTLHTVSDAWEFINSTTFLEILSKSNALEFKSPESINLRSHSFTSPEIIDACKDLKVLGKKDFKDLLKWREQIRISMDMDQKKVEINKIEEEKQTLEEEMSRDHHLSMNREKKEKKKSQERKAKSLQKLNLGMQTPMDIGIEAGEAGIHIIQEQASLNERDEDSEANDSEDENRRKLAYLENEMDELYNQYQARKLKKDPKALVKSEKDKEKSKAKADFEEWYGIENDKKRKLEDSECSDNSASDSDSDDSSDSDNESEMEQESVHEPIVLSKKASTFFSNPLFESIKIEQELSTQKQTKKQKTKPALPTSDFEVVPKENQTIFNDEDGEEEDDEAYLIKTAKAYSIAQNLTTKSSKSKAIDDSFNKYAFEEKNLPPWFEQDEKKHHKPNIPITKEAVKIMKDRLKALDARPIKKVAEAKFRKQMRTMRRAEKLKAKANNLVEDEDNETKLTDIQKMLSKGNKKRPDKKPKLVVAKGSNRGLQGRPSGVKGRYKMIDGRMKKELRAEKRIKKASKGKRR